MKAGMLKILQLHILKKILQNTDGSNCMAHVFRVRAGGFLKRPPYNQVADHQSKKIAVEVELIHD
jgi:hypothetical protein